MKTKQELIELRDRLNDFMLDRFNKMDHMTQKNINKHTLREECQNAFLKIKMLEWILEEDKSNGSERQTYCGCKAPFSLHV